MEVLSGILALVFLALLVMFVIGLIAPGKVFLGKTAPAVRLQWFTVLAVSPLCASLGL